jgi:hypothetical protein
MSEGLVDVKNQSQQDLKELIDFIVNECCYDVLFDNENNHLVLIKEDD